MAAATDAPAVDSVNLAEAVALICDEIIEAARALNELDIDLLKLEYPGSPEACRLALEKLIIPELGHLARELSR